MCGDQKEAGHGSLLRASLVSSSHAIYGFLNLIRDLACELGLVQHHGR